jgi:DNA polymerase III delta prime subunit
MMHLRYEHSVEDKGGWDNRYRPHTLEEVLLPRRLKSRLISFRDHQTSPALLFYGAAGTGKTTTALALDPKADLYHLNASSLNDKDLKRSDFECTMSAMPLIKGSNRRKLIILDEADALTERAQMSLRSMIEQYASSSWFVFVVNDLQRMIDPIQSRTVGIGFGLLKDAEEMEALMVDRCLSILRIEQRTVPIEAVRELVRRNSPDMRRVLNHLQFESTAA